MADLTGVNLGKVRIDMFLARGGMADVYLGTHTTLQRAVAVKLMKSDLQSEPDLEERFQREARVVAMLRHPNIVQVYDFDTYQGQPYLVMEYVSGTSLANYLRKLHENNQRLELAQVDLLLNKIADGLNYAHEKGVIHRDIKPGNILLTSRISPVTAGLPLPVDTEPILTDFGLVRFRQSKTKTATGLITGTPAYMSPEQARGATVDTRTDVYSLGITLYEMLAGRVPFDADSTLTILHMHIYEPPPPIEGISDALQGVISLALAKDPDQRYKTPLELAQAFRAALYETAESPTLYFPITKTETKPSLYPVKTEIKPIQKRWVQAGIGLGVFGLIGLFALLNTNTPSIPVILPTSTSTEVQAHVMDNGDYSKETIPSTKVNESSAPIVAIFRFLDGTAPADQVTLTTVDMPPPSEGSQYEAWLIEESGEQRRSIGLIAFDETGKGSLKYIDTMGRNLLGLYHGVEITIEPEPDPSPNPSNNIAYSMNLPPGGLAHVRHLLSSFGGAPNNTALAQGLKTDANLLNQTAQTMLVSFEAGKEADVRLEAEKMMNIIVGDQSPDYKDWNGDGTVDDISDGYGLLLNGENAGYIQGVYTHANLAATSADATQNMIDHGEHVKISATNLADWSPQLRDQLNVILSASFGPEMEAAVRQAVALANQIENGIDTNGNERIEPIPGEGGALTAYSHAAYMADITIHADSVP
jgi:serine/threonine protein kinase